MLLDDTLLMKGDEDMTDKKDDKSPEDDSLFGNSGELFETLFRDELDTLTKGKKEKAVPKSSKKAGAAKSRKSTPQSNPAKPRKADPQRKTKKPAREKPISRVHVDRPKRVSSRAAPKTAMVAEEKPVSKVVEKKPVSADQGDAHEEVRPKKRAKFRKIRSDKIGTQPKIGGGSDKIKIAVLSVILVAAIAFIINTLGIVDFGGLLGFSEPAKKERIKPRVAKKPPAKTDKKTTRVAINKPQKKRTPQAPKKATPQNKKLTVKKPPQASPSKAQPLTVKKRPAPTPTAKKPVITQQRYRPVTPTQKPPAVQPPPKPVAPQQRPVDVKKPPQPTASTQKPVPAPKPSKSMTLSPRPVVAKKPPAVTTPKPPPVVKKPATPVRQKGKMPALGKEELLPEESLLPYPYSVYLGAYKTPQRAEKAISLYRKKGLSAYWVKVNLGEKGVWYRVFTGYFKDQNEAEAFIRRKGLADAKAKRTKYATLIGVYATETGAQKKFLVLSKLGYSPYVIETNSGESQLYVGAFYTQAGAEEQRTDLSSKGIQSRVVER
jgi:cell division septation protein DedD